MSSATEQSRIWAKEERKSAQYEAGQLGMVEDARAMSPAAAIARAKRDVHEYNGIEDASLRLYQAQDMGLRASGNLNYRAELEKAPQAATAAKQALVVGDQMPKADWHEAKALAGGAVGRVYLPKMMTEYAGKIVMVTDTHLVQQTGRNTVVAHDVRRVQDLPSRAQLQGQTVKFSYGAISAKSEILDFTPTHQATVRQLAQELADRNIKSPQARGNFISQVEKSMVAAINHKPPQRTPERQQTQADRREPAGLLPGR